VLRIAHADNDDIAALLDANADEYPISADIRLQYSADSNNGSYSFLFTTVSMSTGEVRSPDSPRSTNGSLLMVALDHHFGALLEVEKVLGGMYSCIKGQLTGVLGRQWRMTEKLTNISYLVPNIKNINSSEADEIRASLQVRCHTSHASAGHLPGIFLSRTCVCAMYASLGHRYLAIHLAETPRVSLCRLMLRQSSSRRTSMCWVARWVLWLACCSLQTSSRRHPSSRCSWSS
jgi:endoglucanase Acf2